MATKATPPPAPAPAPQSAHRAMHDKTMACTEAQCQQMADQQKRN